ncbi:M48 family metalloprotease [Candidatus Parcubacteria bacterium]|nr:M48 family metalloprotease [Candidatus Parcubacteria bacterium]
MGLFLGVVIGLGWYFSYSLGNPAILYGAVIFSIVMNVFSFWFSDKPVLKMSGAKPLLKDDNRMLWNLVENLSITAGLPMPKLYVIEDPAPNAFATGRDREHAVVAVTTGLLTILDKQELEGVIAHELSHVGNRDILVSTVVVVLVGFVTLLSDFFIRASYFGGNDRDNRAGGIAMAIGIVLAILSPLVATLIQLAISRKREFLADASGALLTRYPEGLAKALEKIGMYARPLRRANNATAHLFISNPFGSVRRLGGLFMTHPPIEERVKALRGLE